MTHPVGPAWLSAAWTATSVKTRGHNREMTAQEQVRYRGDEGAYIHTANGCLLGPTLNWQGEAQLHAVVKCVTTLLAF